MYLPVRSRDLSQFVGKLVPLMALPELADGRDDMQMWRVPLNVLNEKSGTSEKSWSSSLGTGTEDSNLSARKLT
jgi:hypothetical protein